MKFLQKLLIYKYKHGKIIVFSIVIIPKELFKKKKNGKITLEDARK